MDGKFNPKCWLKVLQCMTEEHGCRMCLTPQDPVGGADLIRVRCPGPCGSAPLASGAYPLF